MHSTSLPHQRASGGAPGAAPPPLPGKDAESSVFGAVRDSRAFGELRRSYRRFAFSMTAAFLVLYILYVLLCTYAPHLVATKVVGNVNAAFLIGLAQFASTFAIAWLYTRFANARLDPVADWLRSEAGLDGEAGVDQEAGPERRAALTQRIDNRPADAKNGV
ncbi:DUF485 domain-containing protein [Wenjunlia tyrosinilytica]|uniref:DUF485 domain-containing protein n=1 Tax=Wenjunlia tyrosinilytica TaxID=1544741 RepID=UPI0016683C04|nr:DUF485 domain-containing protein [Wenjunlia tyrosinilytica]